MRAFFFLCFNLIATTCVHNISSTNTAEYTPQGRWSTTNRRDFRRLGDFWAKRTTVERHKPIEFRRIFDENDIFRNDSIYYYIFSWIFIMFGFAFPSVSTDTTETNVGSSNGLQNNENRTSRLFGSFGRDTDEMKKKNVFRHARLYSISGLKRFA